MNLYSSERSFEVGGQSYEGFPILVDSRGAIVEVALRYFVYALLGSSVSDLKTWEAYGRHLYDYFGYLEAKGFRWEYVPEPDSGDVSPLAHYAHWCNKTVGDKPGYFNDKLGTIRRFYLWAQLVGLVDKLPFRGRKVTTPYANYMFSYTSANEGRESTDLHNHESEEPISVLTRSQIDIALQSTINPTHRAILHLGLNTGLRAEELTTFPAHYVIDCSNLSRKVKTVPVNLNPKDMDTKNSKARTVRVSVGCMNLLWQYRESIRPALQRVGGAPSSRLFLTRYGQPFVSDGLVAPLARLGRRCGFHIHPHMLRHSFATHTLASLEDLKRAGRLRSSPLIVLKGLLGHNSTTTTSRYLHHLDAIDDTYGTSYQAEIDALALGYLKEQE